MRQRSVFEFGDDLLDDRVRAVGFSASSIGSGLLVNTAVRHEALLFRAEVEGLRGWPVVAGW